MLGNIGPLEIMVVLIIALIVFGPKRLPELGGSLGRGIREFRGAVSGGSKDVSDDEPKKLANGEVAATASEREVTPEKRT